MERADKIRDEVIETVSPMLPPDISLFFILFDEKSFYVASGNTIPDETLIPLLQEFIKRHVDKN
jgi:hypothetical protein